MAAEIKAHLQALFEDSDAFELYAEEVVEMSVEAIMEYLPLLLLARKLEQIPYSAKPILMQSATQLDKNKDDIKVCVKGRTYYLSHRICNTQPGCTVKVPSAGCPFRLFQKNNLQSLKMALKHLTFTMKFKLLDKFFSFFFRKYSRFNESLKRNLWQTDSHQSQW